MEQAKENQWVFDKSENLTARATELLSTADNVQKEGMLNYLRVQEKALEQMNHLLETYRLALTNAAKKVMESTDEKVTAQMLEAFDRYGLKEE